MLSNLGDSFLKFAADNLNYPQQCLRVQDAAHLYQHLVLSVVLIFRVFFLVVVVCLIMAFKIFQMINEIEYFCLC